MESILTPAPAHLDFLASIAQLVSTLCTKKMIEIEREVIKCTNYSLKEALFKAGYRVNDICISRYKNSFGIYI